MIVKNRTIVGSIESLNALGALKLPAKTSFRLGMLLLKVNEVMSVFEKVRRTIIEGAAKKKEDGNLDADANGIVQVNDPVGFNKSMDNLLDVEVQLDVGMIMLDELGDAQIEPRHMAALTWLLAERS